MVVLQTERLYLRQQQVADAPFILQLVNDSDWIRYIGDRGLRTVEAAEAHIRDGAMAMYTRHGFGLYLVETKVAQVPIGICGLVRRDFLDEVDLGFALMPQYRGKGYAYEAAQATIDYARSEIGLERLLAIVLPDNVASIRLLERLGYQFDQPYDYPNGDLVHLYTLALC